MAVRSEGTSLSCPVEMGRHSPAFCRHGPIGREILLFPVMPPGAFPGSCPRPLGAQASRLPPGQTHSIPGAGGRNRFNGCRQPVDPEPAGPFRRFRERCDSNPETLAGVGQQPSGIDPWGTRPVSPSPARSPRHGDCPLFDGSFLRCPWSLGDRSRTTLLRRFMPCGDFSGAFLVKSPGLPPVRCGHLFRLWPVRPGLSHRMPFLKRPENRTRPLRPVPVLPRCL